MKKSISRLFFLTFLDIFFLLGNRFEDVGFFSLYFFSLLRNHQKWVGGPKMGRGQPKENETYH